ncbi:MAG TPA: molybdopterin dinucleotide binding domain-containing protein, partial [Burkholderiales bacterium]
AHGYYLREPATGAPIVASTLEGSETHVALEIGADGEVLAEGLLEGETAFAKLASHMQPNTPEWAQDICDVPAARIRRIANEYLDAARVGQTIEIEGKTLPYRPVAVSLGKTVTNGWGGFECCWARTLLAALVGALEVPGGILGTTVRLNRPMSERHKSVRAGPDGLMAYPFNPTDARRWSAQPNIRNAYRTMVPLAGDGPWSQALGPTHFSWMFLDETPPGLPRVTLPEVWFLYRSNPAISFWDTALLEARMARFPFVVAFAFTRDETNHYADVLLPDATDLESLQLIRIGGSKYIEQFWDHEGFALRQPAIAPRGAARDFTDIATALAERTGLLEPYHASINRGALGVRLGEFALEPSKAHSRDEIWDAACRAASFELSGGKESHGLAWWKEKGLATKPFPRTAWYLFPTLAAKGLRFEMPYQERLLRIGTELGRRLHEHGMTWWDQQLTEYQALPAWKDFPGIWDSGEQYPFWLLTSRSMQYAWGGNVGMQMIKEVADNIAGHSGVIMNKSKARQLGIDEGDWLEIATAKHSVRARAVLRQGIRPDTLLLLGQFGHWATPVAKDFGMPSMNPLVPMSLELTDATGSGADIVRVALRKAA